MDELKPGTELCCATCRVKVSRCQAPDGTAWYGHPGPSDHEVTAIAMETADVIHVCDFCLAPHPRWAFPLLERASTSSPVHPESGFRVDAIDTDGWWGACEECAGLVTSRQIGRLRDKALAVAGKTVRARYGRGITGWEKQSVIIQLAAFWTGGPGSPVEIL